MKLTPNFVLAFLVISFSTYAIANTDSERAWDEIRFHGLPAGVSYQIEMGSGFFINRNTIITNKHVLGEGICRNVAIRGAVEPQLAEILLIDKDLDLALLRTKSTPLKVPYLRMNTNQIDIGDTLFSVGYPLDNSISGNYIIKEAVVMNVAKVESTGFLDIEFTDNIDHGNSGGPLLDKNSNIVGVVTAKITSYDKDDPENTKRSVGMAIGIDGVMNFLKKNNISYGVNYSYDVFTNYNVDKQVRGYVVNIHCVK